MTPPAAAVDEEDEAVTVQEGAPWGEMLRFVHPTPGTVAVVVAVATVSFVVMIALPPATRRAATAEPAPSDEASDAARQGGAAREFCCSSKEQEGHPAAGWLTSLSMVSFFYSRALPSFGPLKANQETNQDLHNFYVKC